MDELSTPDYEFGGFRLDTAAQALISPGGEPVALPSRAYDTLKVLVEHAGVVVEKAALMRAVWPKTVVEENNLNQCILTLRRAVGEEAGERRFILTIPGRGFKFIAPVAVVPRSYAAGAGQVAAEPAGLVAPKGSIDTAAAIWNRRRGVMAAGAIALVALAVIAVAFSLRSYAPSSVKTDAGQAVAPVASSVAVLPFLDLSEKQDQGYFADGITEEITDRLARGSDLRVAARTSTFYFKDRKSTIAEIGKMLGVAHILEGSVRRSGSQLRITAQLIRTADGYHEWSGSIDRTFDDVFAAQDEIAAAVVSTLKASLLGPPGSNALTTNAEAHALYLQALALWHSGTNEENRRAVAYLRRATTLDPRFAGAWALLAKARTGDFSVFADSTRDEVGAEALHAATTALELAPNLADAHLALAGIMRDLNWDLDGAGAEYKRALELDANNTAALRGLSSLAQMYGDLEHAESFARRGLALDPVDWVSYWKLGEVQWFAGNLPDAERTFRKQIELHSTAYDAHTEYAVMLMTAGRAEEALAELEKDADPDERQIVRPTILQRLGRHAEAARLMPDVERKFGGFAAHEIAMYYAELGDFDHTFEWLDRSASNHEPMILFLRDDPPFRALHADARFGAMLKRLKLVR